MDGDGDGDPMAAGTDPAAARWRPTPSDAAALAALAVLVLAGAWARHHGLTRLGLYRDDAWVALTTDAGPRTALRMSATAPGYTLGLRSWLHLAAPTTSWWGQLPTLTLAVAGIPAAYVLCRVHDLSARLALVAATAVAASPVAISFSVRLKPYAFDLVAACVLLALAERARTSRSMRVLGALAGASVLALLTSASVAPVVIGCWTALLLHVLLDRRGPVRTVAWGAATTAGCAATYAVLFRDLPPGIAATWHDYYLDPSSPADAWRTGQLAATRLVDGLVRNPLGDHPLVTVLALALVVVGGLVAGRRAWASLLALVVAVGAAALEVAPIGTGRIDEVLYPPLLLLVGLGLAAAGRMLATTGWAERSRPWRAGAATVAVALVVGVGATTALRHPARYPGTDLQALVQAVDARRAPGDLVVVEARTRYLWALLEDEETAITFDDRWLTGFTVASRRPDVFVQPSYSVEQGYTPTRWARLAAGATRVLYVATPFEGPDPPPDAAYRALVRAGWVPVEVVTVTRGTLTVLERPPGEPPG